MQFSIMILTLIFITSFLSLIHYLGMESILYRGIALPLPYYLGFLGLLIVVRFSLFVCKYLPIVRNFVQSLARFIDREETNNASSVANSNRKNKGIGVNQNRSYSTSAVNHDSNLNKSPSNKLRTSRLAGILNSRRIKGLFASILENGSMVSLAGTWSKDAGHNTQAAANTYAAELASRGILTKVKEFKGKYYVYRLEQGTVADLISAFGWRVISFCFPNKVKFAGRLRLLKLFSNYVWRIYKTNGSEQVVKFLKASQLAVQKAIAKDRIDSLRAIDKTLVRTKLSGYGLPTIIPSRDRKLIAGGSPSIIRFWLTLFSLYRVIDIPGQLKLQTIIAPFDGDSVLYSSVAQSFNAFLKASSVVSMVDKKLLYRKARVLFLETASSTHKVSWMGLFSDPKLLFCLGLSAYARNIMLLLGQTENVVLFDALLAATEKVPDVGKDRFNTGEGVYSHADIANPEGVYAGKLSIKKEAAGKLRVFAMVTVWDQMVLKPIHDALFAFLKSLPNDGTFDQHASEMRAREKAARSGRSWGYDLSAATDRLPLLLQTMFLNLLVPDLGDNWALLLTKRSYYMYIPEDCYADFGIPKGKKSISAMAARGGKMPNAISIMGRDVNVYYNEDGRAYTELKYAVGQPMGALSSWAMLAVTHHLIVQFAYRRAYNIPMNTILNKETWFTEYEVLGDDIIIFDEKVAHEYLQLMDAFGVPINTTKSVCATVPVTEFAKVTSYYGTNVSALSWKMFMSGNSLMGRVNIVYHMLSRGIVKYNIIPWIERSTALSLHKPGLLNPTLIALWTMLSNRKLITVEDALRALIDGKVKVFKLAKAILFNADVNKIKLALPGIFTGRGLFLYESKSVAPIWNIELPWFKITMWKPLAVFQAKRDIEADALELTKSVFWTVFTRIVDEPLSKLESLNICSLDELDHGNFFQDGVPVLPGELNNGEPYSVPDNRVNDWRVLFSALHSIILEKALSLGGPEAIDNMQIDSNISDLVEANEALDRYNEFKELHARMIIKTDPTQDVAPPKVVRPTELKLLKLLAKMGNRPAFTTALNL